MFSVAFMGIDTRNQNISNSDVHMSSIFGQESDNSVRNSFSNNYLFNFDMNAVLAGSEARLFQKFDNNSNFDELFFLLIEFDDEIFFY